MNIIVWDNESVWPDIWPKINVGHCDLYFMVQWFCLISWRLFDVWTSLFGIMSQCDPKFDLKINIGHCDLYFMVQWFGVTSWRLFDVWTSYFGIMGQYDPVFDLKINVGLCDLYFMVQWFCLISPRLFDTYFQLVRQCDPDFDLKVNTSVIHRLTLSSICRSVTYILWSSHFASYLEDYWMEKFCTWDNGSVWLKDRPCKIYVGQWPVFHGQLILPSIIVIDLNYFYTVSNGTSQGYSCPSWHLL